MIPMHAGSGAPEFLVHGFMFINLGIALCYGLLAFYFTTRIKLPGKSERNWLTVVACVGAGVFFIGCAHTHLDLAIWAATDNLRDHWYSWWNVLSHLLQGLGGLTFWVLATFYLQLNIYDKRHYEKVINEVEEEADVYPEDLEPSDGRPEPAGPVESVDPPVDREDS